MRRLPGLLKDATLRRWRAALATRPGGSLQLADALALAEVLNTVRDALLPLLPPAPQLVASQCWVRRATPPHSWHQDGALHHDFQTIATPLPMWTCWIPLVPCGRDAPGLEWAEPGPATLLPPRELTDAAVRARFPHIVSPELAAGEALLFDGALLHRTSLPLAMAQPRTSIELRLVAHGAPPPRLAGETLLAFA
jgi:ectoine hydroxylase-related dioxygenase (phytanoyl-CoA dioxygenase family)